MVKTPNPTPVDDTPRTRAAQLAAIGIAAKALFGNSGTEAVVNALLPDASDELEKALEQKDRFVPEAIVLACYRGVFTGPAQQDADVFRSFVSRVVEEGFGATDTVRLTAIAPVSLLKQAAELWRSDHTHGELSLEETEDAAVLTLREHPFVDDELGHTVMLEFYRAALGHTAATKIECTAEPSGDTLAVRFRWAE